MPRTNVSDVKDIIELDTLSDEEIRAFVQDSNQIVDNTLKGNTTDANLKLIEKYLAAHLCSLREQRISEETVGPITKRYEGDEYEMGLKSTRYGQMAIEMDPTGRLEAISRNVVTVNPVATGEDGFAEYYQNTS